MYWNIIKYTIVVPLMIVLIIPIAIFNLLMRSAAYTRDCMKQS